MSELHQGTVRPLELTAWVWMFHNGSVVIYLPTRLGRFVVGVRVILYLLVPAGNRDQSVVVLIGVFDDLHTKKYGTEEHRQQDQYHLNVPVPFLRVVDRERHRQAADDEHECIQSAPESVEVITAGRERHRELRAKHQVHGEQTAEEHDLLHKEHPHPDRDALFLLLHVFELVLKTWLMIMLF